MNFSNLIAVFLFIVKIRWPVNTSFFNVLKQRYGQVTLLKFRNIEKLRKKLDKTKLDITYLEDCLINNIVPKFLSFKLSNRRLQNSQIYHETQIKFLREEINNHRKVLLSVNKDYQKEINELQILVT